MELLAGLRPVDTDAPDRLFRDKTWADVGVDPELTDHLQRKLDPDGSKYGGDVEKLKTGFLNDMTMRKSGIVSSTLDWISSFSEDANAKQNANLAERLYETAPNRLFGANQPLEARGQALAAGLKGGLYGEGAAPLELALNWLLSPVSLAAAGFKAAKAATVGAAASRIAAGEAGRDLASKLGSEYIFREGEREAAEAAIKSQAWRSAAKRAAIWEGSQNAVLGGVGGAAEHGAAENRGIETGSMLGDVALGAGMGGVLGGVIGGAMGIHGGRAMSRELVGEAPVKQLAGSGVKTIPERGLDISNAAKADAEAQAASAAAEAAKAAGAAPQAGARDGALDLSVNLREMEAHVEQIAKEAGVDRGASRFSRETLSLMSDTLARSSDITGLAARLRQEAATLTSVKDPKPDAVARAGELERDARVLDRFSETMADPDQRAAMLEADDVHPILAQALPVIEPRLAPMMEADLAPKAPPKAAPGAQANAAPAGPAPAPAGGAPAAAAPSAAPPAPKPAAAAEVAPEPVKPATPAAASAAANEIEQLRPHFSPDDAAAVAEAETTLAKGGTDINTAITRIEADGGTAALGAEVAKVSGEPVESVLAKLGKAAGAVTKARAAVEADAEASKAAAAAPTAPAPVAAAPEPAPTTAAITSEVPAVSPTPAPAEIADVVAPAAPASTYEAISQAATAFALSARARLNEMLSGLVDEINAQGASDEAAAVSRASRKSDGAAPQESSDAEIADAKAHRRAGGHLRGAAVPREVSAVEQKIAAGLDELRADPDFGPLFDGVTPEMLLTRAGKEAVEARIERAANDSVGWHYATAIAPMMRDIFNVGDFERLLSLMPGVPESERRRLSDYYTRQARLALAHEAGKLGSAEAAVARYGAAAEALLAGKEPGPGAVKPAEFSIDLKGIIEEFTADMDGPEKGEVGKALRRFKEELIGSGFADDEAVIASALRARAAEAAAQARVRGINRAIRESVKDATAAADPRFTRMLSDAPDFVIEVMQVGNEYGGQDFRGDRYGSFVPNPIVQRIGLDARGNKIPLNFADTGELVTGRVVTPGKEESGKQRTFGRTGVGGSQGMFRLADEFGVIGKLRSVVLSARGAAHAIDENKRAFIDAAGRQRRDRWGKSTKGSAGGARAEKLAVELDGKAARMEQARMGRIIELVWKRDESLLSEDEFKAAIESEGKFMRPVRDSEIAFAREWGEAQERIANAREMAQKRADDILEDMRQGGVNMDQAAGELSARLQSVIDSSGLRIRSGIKGMASEAPAGKKAGKEAADAVTFRGKDGKSYEFVPSKHVELDDKGNIKLLGQVVGTYTKDGDKITASIIGHPDPSVTVSKVSSLGRQLRKGKAARDVLNARLGELSGAPAEAANLPEGAVIPETFSNTKAVDEAVSELSGNKDAAMTPELRATQISTLDIPSGYMLVLREKGTRNFYRAKASHKTIGDIVPDAPAGTEFIVGMVPVLQNKSGGVSRQLGSIDRAMATFVPYGRDPSKVGPDVERVVAAAQKHKDSAPVLVKAQHGPITLRQADGITMADGTTLADAHLRFTSEAIWRDIPNTKADLDALIARLSERAAEIKALAPHGITRPTSSRKVSFNGLAAAMAKSSLAEREIALDLLRRLDVDAASLPRFYPDPRAAEHAELGGGSFASSPAYALPLNAVAVTPGGAMPGHIGVVHEVAHWAFVNVLSPEEQIDFLRTLGKLYGEDGNVSIEAFGSLIPSARALEAKLGKSFGGLGGLRAGPQMAPNELFAWQFTHYFMDVARGGDHKVAEIALWKRVVGIVHAAFEHFFGNTDRIEPELRTLFERIMPSSPRESQYRYDQMLDTATGELRKRADTDDKRATAAWRRADQAKVIDELRGKIDAHLFSLREAPAYGLAMDLYEAAKHMQALLHGERGNDRGGIPGMRAAMRLLRNDTVKDAEGNPVFKRDANGRVLKADGEDGRPLAARKGGKFAGLRETALNPTGAINHWRLFGRDGGGEVMGAVGEHVLGREFSDAGSGEFEGVERMAREFLVTDSEAELWNAVQLSKYEELLAANPKADLDALEAQASKFADEKIGVVEKSQSMWDGLTDAMSKGQRADYALRIVALKMRDLMTDSLEFLDGQIAHSGYRLQRNNLAERVAPKAVRTAEEVATNAAIDKAASTSATKTKKAAKPKPPTTDSTAEAAAREAAAGGGDATPTRTIPAGAPPGIKAVVSRVTHRDPDQKDVIDGIGYDIFNVLGIDKPTNADIARLTGVELEPGVVPGAPAAASQAFDEFRSTLRRVSENMTNADGNLYDAISEIAELLLRGRSEGGSISRAANAVVAKSRKVRNLGSLPKAEQTALEAAMEDPALMAMVDDTLAEVLHIMAARTKVAVPEALDDLKTSPVAAVVTPQFASDGALHYAHAERIAQERIAALNDEAVDELAARLGLYFDGDELREKLIDSISYYQPGSLGDLAEMKGRTIRLGAPIAGEKLMPGSRDIPLAQELISIDAELAKLGSGPEAEALIARRQHTLEALRNEPGFEGFTDAAKPVLLDMSKIADFGNPDQAVLALIAARYNEVVAAMGAKATLKSKSPERLAAIVKAVRENDGEALLDQIATGLNAKALRDVMVSADLYGYRSRGETTVFDRSVIHDFDEMVKSVHNEYQGAPDLPDAPMAGEEFLRLIGDPDVKFDGLGLQQRSLQMGADPQAASIVSRFIPGRQAPAPSEELVRAAKKFSWPVQLRENASRIRKAGANWLADLIKPTEGAGFSDELASALGRTAYPILKRLDEVAGRTDGFKRWLDDLKRNGALHKEEIPQSEGEKEIATALRNGTLHRLTEDKRTVALEIKAWFADMLQRQRDAGIPVGDIVGRDGVESYLPQRFNALWIHAHPDEAASRLAKWFEKQGREASDAKVRAKNVISRVLDADEGGSILGGEVDPVYRSAFSGDLYSRILNISSKDMGEMGLSELFDNNLRTLMTNYAQNAETRIAATNRFGVKGHALDTYLDIARRGKPAVVESLMGGTTGFRRSVGTVATSDMTQDEVGFADRIISPLTQDRREAEALVDQIVSQLTDTNNIRAKQQAVAGMLAEMYRQRSKDTVSAQHFAKRAEAIVAGLSDFGPDGMAMHPEETIFAREFTGRLIGEAVHMGEAERRAAPYVKGLMTFNAVTLLGMATVASFGDAAMPLVRSGNFQAWGKGMVTLAKQIMGMGPEAVEAARGIGVSFNQAVHQGMTDIHGGKAGRITNTFFLANGLTPWTNTMRNISAVVGFESIKTAQLIAQRERAAGNFESRAYMKNMRYLRQMGAAGLVDAEPLSTLAANQDNEVLRQAIHRFVNESVFEPGRNDVPLQFQDNPFWKLAFQFKSYPLMLGRMTKRAIMEAGATETTGSGKKVYVGDVKPLAFLMTVGVGMAAGAQAARDVISGRNQESDPEDSSGWRSIRDRKWSKVVQGLGFKDYEMDDEQADSILGWYVESLLGLGALGMVGDMFYQSAQALDNGSFGRERIMSQILGPSYGTFNSALQAFEGATDQEEESNSKERIAVRAVARRAPLVGNQQPWVEGMVDWFAGEAQPK